MRAASPSTARPSTTRPCIRPTISASPPISAWSGERMTTLRLAHRGDWRAAPENSLAAMQAALRIPACDGLEFDLRCSVDGVPVLLHDASLERVQGILLACSILTAAQLAEHGIPTLGEVLKTVGCDPFLDVELKRSEE